MSVIDVKRTDEVLFVAEDGTPVTGNMIQNWSDAYDRGVYPGPVVDISPIGRPRLAKNEKTMNVSFRCPESGVDLISRAAAATGMRKSEFMRSAALEKAERVLANAS